ncbi:dermonecrotic toxin LspiSicTox-betaIE1i-like [Brevipalpus obovatus]|uniref:dermonecrotic toxin LspiSicTox-betaIE1i-like n=1 Tax=Brevipalpus obovatus TaxID=246614 RepID=UPI003D9F1E15
MHVFRLDLSGATKQGLKFAAAEVVQKMEYIMKKAKKYFFIILLVDSKDHLITFEHLNLNGTLGEIYKGRLGYGVINGNASDNSKALAEKNIGPEKIWLGFDYYWNGFPFSELYEGIKKREEGRVSKVIADSLPAREKPENKRIRLRANVDGIISDKPEQLTEILCEPEFKGRFRLATAEDKPPLNH